MILKILNVDKTFVRTCERSNTFANADERSQKINVNVQNSILYPYVVPKAIGMIQTLFFILYLLIYKNK